MRAARCNVDKVTLQSFGSSKRPTWLRLVLIFVAKPLRESSLCLIGRP
jgi:hypothetical protein